MGQAIGILLFWPALLVTITTGILWISYAIENKHNKDKTPKPASEHHLMAVAIGLSILALLLWSGVIWGWLGVGKDAGEGAEFVAQNPELLAA